LPTALDWILFVLVTVGLPLRALHGMRRLRAAVGSPALDGLRAALWRRALFTQWSLVAVLAALWLARGREWDWIGLAPRASWGLAGVLLGVGFITVLMLRQRAEVASQPDLAGRVRARLAAVEPLMPHARTEWPAFAALAITAGACEEILFRGFVAWTLAHVLPSYLLVCLVQSLLFGLGHAYQGPRGVLLTGAVGLFLSGVVWVTGSLWAAMLVHALMDLNAGDLAIRVYGTANAPSSRAAGT